MEKLKNELNEMKKTYGDLKKHREALKKGKANKEQGFESWRGELEGQWASKGHGIDAEDAWLRRLKVQVPA